MRSDTLKEEMTIDIPSRVGEDAAVIKEKEECVQQRGKKSKNVIPEKKT